MMLGEFIDDPHGVEGGGRHAGLGLLPTSTVMTDVKRTVRTTVDFGGQSFDGYEIRYGDLSDGSTLVTDGNVIATTVHGLFEHPEFIEMMLGVRVKPVLEPTFELLADAVEEHLDTDFLRSLL
jgi:adenosylcobyric acid synthase